MIKQPSRCSFVNTRTGERVTARSLQELRLKGARILEEEADARTALLEKLGAPSLLRPCPSPAGGIIDVDVRARPMTTVQLVGSRPR
jgi:hypothetical protein